MSPRWVVLLSAFDQKRTRMNRPQQCLDHFNRSSSHFFRSFITDEMLSLLQPWVEETDQTVGRSGWMWEDGENHVPISLSWAICKHYRKILRNIMLRPNNHICSGGRLFFTRLQLWENQLIALLIASTLAIFARFTSKRLFLFHNLKKRFSGRRFASNEEVTTKLEIYFYEGDGKAIVKNSKQIGLNAFFPSFPIYFRTTEESRVLLFYLYYFI